MIIFYNDIWVCIYNETSYFFEKDWLTFFPYEGVVLTA